MLNKNNMLTGILIALIFPAIACVAAYFLKNNFYVANKPALPYLVAIALNLVLIRVGLKKELDKTARGIMLSTFVFFVMVFIFVIRIK